MEELMKKSIFIQRERFEDIKFITKAIFDMYSSFGNPSESSIQKIDLDNANIIKEVTLPMPLLNEGDSFYFENEHKAVTIQEVMRSDKDNVVYVIEDKVDYEPKSLKQYEIDKQKYLDIKELKKELKDAVRTKDKKKIKELIKD